MWSSLLDQPRADDDGSWRTLLEQPELQLSVRTTFSGNGTTRRPVVNMFNFSSSPQAANSKSNRIAEYLSMGAQMASNRLGWLGVAMSSISNTALEASDYKRYYTPATRQLIQRGFVLIMTEELAGDLNAFGRKYSDRKMTGAAITSMAKEFDRLFCPVYSGFFAPLVAIEWPQNPKGVYDSRSGSHHSKGGMRGGDSNAYWGITQFGNSSRAPTYNETVAAAARYGVMLPAAREAMTFGHMLVAAYVLAIVRQPTLVSLGIPVNAETIYVNHNQGNGVWLAKQKRIPAYNWDKQSAQVHSILTRYGFTRA